MSTDRTLMTATLLEDGDVLVAGGEATTGQAYASAELYDPSTGTWSLTGSMSAARADATATLLPNGEVLVAGGYAGQGGQALASAELYDSSTGTWTQTASMSTPREGATATLLRNGSVLVAGGEVPRKYNTTLASTELYNPATGTWSATGSMLTPRNNQTATLLEKGEVLIAGGEGTSSVLASAELYEPSTGTWSATGPMSAARDGMTATLVPDGEVLVAGGSGLHGDGLASAELYDPLTGTWDAAGTMRNVRFGQTATLLRDGSVLVAGGSVPSLRNNALASAELYTPPTSPSPPMPHPTSAKVAITTTRVVVSHRAARIGLKCTGRVGSRCDGTVSLTIRSQAARRRGHGHVTFKTIVFAHASYALTSGGRHPLTLPITHAGLSALDRARGHQLTAQANVTIKGGRTVRRSILVMG
jgi:N-acetylneuraminic acid mutarotase